MRLVNRLFNFQNKMLVDEAENLAEISTAAYIGPRSGLKRSGTPLEGGQEQKRRRRKPGPLPKEYRFQKKRRRLDSEGLSDEEMSIISDESETESIISDTESVASISEIGDLELTNEEVGGKCRIGLDPEVEKVSRNKLERKVDRWKVREISYGSGGLLICP